MDIVPEQISSEKSLKEPNKILSFLKNNKFLVVFPTLILFLIFVSLIVSVITDKHTCGQTSVYYGLGDQKKNDTRKLQCIVNALNNCKETSLVINSSDWEGGKSTTVYEVVSDPISDNCSLNITSETSAFYIPYGYSKTKQTCRSLSLLSNGLTPKDCSNLEEVFDYCAEPNNEHKALCKTHEAVVKNDQDLCEEVGFEWGEQDCLQQIAKSTNNIDICNSLQNERVAGKCIADISLSTNKYNCNKATNKTIEKGCNLELLGFNENKVHNLEGINEIKKFGQITVAVGSNIWNVGTKVTRLNNDGSVELWLNGTLHTCNPGEKVFLRSDGAVCSSSVPIYYVTQCQINGNNVTLDYYTYTAECNW